MKQTTQTEAKQVSHTPGEWQLNYFKDGDYSITVEYPEGYKRICMVNNDNGYIENYEAKANAQLIASAPTLKAENEKLKADKAVLLNLFNRVKDIIMLHSGPKNFSDEFENEIRSAIKQINQ